MGSEDRISGGLRQRQAGWTMGRTADATTYGKMQDARCKMQDARCKMQQVRGSEESSRLQRKW